MISYAIVGCFITGLILQYFAAARAVSVERRLLKLTEQRRSG